MMLDASVRGKGCMSKSTILFYGNQIIRIFVLFCISGEEFSRQIDEIEFSDLSGNFKDENS